MSGRRLGEGGGMMYGSVEVISNLGGQTLDFVPFHGDLVLFDKNDLKYLNLSLFCEDSINRDGLKTK